MSTRSFTAELQHPVRIATRPNGTLLVIEETTYVTAVEVRCDVRGVRGGFTGQCPSRYTTSARSGETKAEAQARALAEAHAGAWRKVGRVLFCGRCAKAHGKG